MTMTMGAMPRVTVDGASSAVWARGRLEPALAAHLPAFLARQRWFAGKGRPIGAARLVDVVPLQEPACRVAVALTEVELAGGRERYQLLLGVCPAQTAEHVLTSGVSWLTCEDGDFVLYDALADAEAARFLLRALADGRVFSGELGSVRCLPLGDLSAARGPQLRISPLDAEQSHSSILVDGRWVFKLLRKLSAGPHPDVEIAQALARHGHGDVMPVLHGSIEYATSVESMSLALLHAFVPNEGDGWSYVTRELKAGADVSRDIESLGAATARAHEALASIEDAAEFRPESAGARDREAWAESLKQDWRMQPVAAAADLPAGERTVLALADAVRRLADAGRVFRIHGDYHLGQVLRTPDGWRLTDFEGEPLRLLADRRAKQSPLRDVAGMLRSLSYAVAVAAPADPESVEARLREAFEAGYFGRAKRAAWLPPAEACRLLVRAFELQKALYELRYEASHRPEWLWVPLSGIRRLLAGTAGAAA